MSNDRKIKAVQRVFLTLCALEELKCTLASVEQSDLPRKHAGQAVDTVTSHFHKMLQTNISKLGTSRHCNVCKSWSQHPLLPSNNS